MGIFINDANGYQTKKLMSVGLPLVNSELLPKDTFRFHARSRIFHQAKQRRVRGLHCESLAPCRWCPFRQVLGVF
jgi:hypothetical protein